VEVLDELTRRLPNHTHLEKVSMEGDRLLLIGLSPEASALVARMEGSTLWRAPALSGALQPDPRTRLDRFSLTAELIGSPAPTTPASGGGQ
jgi:general secretion pathway protein L